MDYDTAARESVTDIQNSVDKLYVTVEVNRILIGTHHYIPKEKVYFTTKGIRIIAPNTTNILENVILDIQKNEVVKMIVCFEYQKCVFFLHVLNSCGSYIRNSLEMPSIHDETKPYFNPTSRKEKCKRIVLMVGTISEQARSVIRSIYTALVIEEVTARDALAMLQTCAWDQPKDIKETEERQIAHNEPSGSASVDTANAVAPIRQILIYPQGKGGITINTEDYKCLTAGVYLNDIIIDFYLKYLQLNVLTAEQRESTHIFGTFFYKRLTLNTHRGKDADTKLSAVQKRHARVGKWTKNVNLFEKDYIIIPINVRAHWILAIICFPSLPGPETFDKVKVKPMQSAVPRKKQRLQVVYVDEDEEISERDEAASDTDYMISDSDSSCDASGPSQREPIKQPCILIFDSLTGPSRNRIVVTLRDYLNCEYKEKMSKSRSSGDVFTKDTMPGHSVKVPQQNNSFDCGLYLLQYVEQFFRDSIKDFHIPIKNLKNWFSTMTVTRKREDISLLLKKLVQRQNPDALELPYIMLPTLNGKLMEKVALEDNEFEIDEELRGEESPDDETDSILPTINQQHIQDDNVLTPTAANGIARTLFRGSLDDKWQRVKKNSRFDELKNF